MLRPDLPTRRKCSEGVSGHLWTCWEPGGREGWLKQHGLERALALPHVGREGTGSPRGPSLTPALALG